MNKKPKKSRSYLLACSGGPDSVYLLHQLLKQGERPVVAHFNHHLRGAESQADETFVKALAQKHRLPFERGGAYVKSYAQRRKLSLEAAARQLRYNFLEKIRKKHKAAAILTAHHQDDQLETLALNRERGAYLKGKMGMQETNGFVKRPLLNTPKTKILEWLHEHQIPYRTDSSNTDLRFRRNKIRQQLATDRKKNPTLVKKILTEAKQARQQHGERTHAANRWLEENRFQLSHRFNNRFPLAAFRALNPDEQNFLLAHLYTLAHGSSLGLSTAQILELRRMLQSGHGGKRKNFGKRLSVRLEAGQVIFDPISS